MSVSLRFRVRPVVRALFACIGALVTFDVALKVLHHVWGYDTVLGLQRLFYVGNESNVPTWYSSAQLAMAALLLVAIAVDARARRAPFAKAWAFLALIFFYISLDEVSQIHEHWGMAFDGVVERQGIFFRRWVVAGIPIVLALGAFFSRFVFSLPVRTRNRMIVSGAVYVGAALGMELVEGWWFTHRTLGLTIELINTIEESGEMIGIALFVRTLLLYIQEERAGVVGRAGRGPVSVLSWGGPLGVLRSRMSGQTSGSPAPGRSRRPPAA